MPEPIKQQIIDKLNEVRANIEDVEYGSIEFIIINGQVDRVETHFSEKVKKTG